MKVGCYRNHSYGKRWNHAKRSANDGILVYRTFCYSNTVTDRQTVKNRLRTKQFNVFVP